MVSSMIKLTDFDYTLPEELIAQEPLTERAQARLMVIDRKTGTIRHDRFAGIGRYLPASSLIVLNNSKVIPARLLGVKRRSGGQVEIFLLKKMPDGRSFECLLRPMRKIQNGDEVVFGSTDLVARITDKARRIVTFNKEHVIRHLEEVGHIPLPPYIRRPDRLIDREFYQTVYARHAGSVAAPTAGLHFTKELLADLGAMGHDLVSVMLHVNYATFQPVEEANISEHVMHEEEFSVSSSARSQIDQAHAEGRPIVAVGTTSCRVLEEMARSRRTSGRTSLFLYPGCRFEAVNVLVTNFHLPRSSLLMLVYAFGGTDLMRRAYQEAVRERYRFYSYGDAMVII